MADRATPFGLPRRAFLGAGLGLLAAAQPALAQQPAAGPAWSRGTRLVLLGTMAGPVLHPSRAMNSQIVFVNGRGLLVDCGYGTIMRMTEMGMRLPDIRQLFITHHHSDHTADYPALLNLAWVMGIRGQFSVYGPPPLRRLHDAALAAFEEDAQIRSKATGREPISRFFAVNEVDSARVVYEDADVKVRCALVEHAPFEVALAYRFDTRERSIVISGDTAYSERLAAFAKGADVLVHEAMLVPGVDRMLARRTNVPPWLRNFLMQGHTTAEDAGRVAALAGVRTLVLSHLLPGDEAIEDSVWINEARKHFAGEIIVGKDKMVI